MAMAIITMVSSDLLFIITLYTLQYNQIRTMIQRWWSNMIFHRSKGDSSLSGTSSYSKVTTILRLTLTIMIKILIHPILSQTESPEVFLCFPSSRPKGSVGLSHKGEPSLVINKIATALFFVTLQPILTMLDKVHTFDLAIGFFNMFLHLVDLSENELSLLNHINSRVLRWNFCWSPPTKESWESFDYDPSRLYKLVEEHGRKPKLLIDKSQTKNVTARKRALLGGPSDRIGANYTPTAKNLLLRCFF